VTTINASTDFSTVVITSGRSVGLTDSNALVLGAATVSGRLGVATSGTITQSGALGVTGTTTLAAGSGNDITLNNASNDFSTVVISAERSVGLTDSNALALGASTVSGTLGVTSAAISKSGAPAVTVRTTLPAASGGN